jgi:hypothetical protein
MRQWLGIGTMGSEQRIIERGGLGRYRPSPNKKGFLSEAFQSIAGGGLEPPTSGL